jgi:hypothetical protein
MTHKEKINRNIGLTFDYVNYLIDNKEEVEKLPKNFEVEFIEKDFSKMESKEEESLNSSMLNKKYVTVRNSFDVAI